MLTRLAEGNPVGSPRAMILTPTRELALQIADKLSPLAAAVGIDLTLIAGGMSYGPQIRAFERGVDVVVATPGRLIDLLEQGAADLSQVQISVLDEADHMADLGFTKDVRTLLDATPEGRAAAAVLRHARRRGGLAGQDLPARPGRPTRWTRARRRSRRWSTGRCSCTRTTRTR